MGYSQRASQAASASTRPRRPATRMSRACSPQSAPCAAPARAPRPGAPRRGRDAPRSACRGVARTRRHQQRLRAGARQPSGGGPGPASCASGASRVPRRLPRTVRARPTSRASISTPTCSCTQRTARLEQLCRYLLRPPVAQERLRLTGDGHVLLELKSAWADGTTHLLFEPLQEARSFDIRVLLLSSSRFNIRNPFSSKSSQVLASSKVKGRLRSASPES